MRPRWQEGRISVASLEWLVLLEFKKRTHHPRRCRLWWKKGAIWSTQEEKRNSRSIIWYSQNSFLAHLGSDCKRVRCLSFLPWSQIWHICSLSPSFLMHPELQPVKEEEEESSSNVITGEKKAIFAARKCSCGNTRFLASYTNIDYD